MSPFLFLCLFLSLSQVYPDWVILHVNEAELSPALRVLYALCCEHLSCEGGMILVGGEPARFNYPSGEFKFSKAMSICNIQEACRCLELELNQFVGE